MPRILCVEQSGEKLPDLQRLPNLSAHSIPLNIHSKEMVTYEGVSESFRADHLEQELTYYSSLLLGAVVTLFCESV